MPVDGLGRLSNGSGRYPALGDVTETVTLADVEVLHVFTEVPSDPLIAALPPMLHPSIPGTAYATFLRCATSPWGPFELAEVRLGARRGSEVRTLLLQAAVNNTDAAAALSGAWGYRCVAAEVSLRRYYDCVQGRVTVDGRTVLDVGLGRPEPIAGAPLQYGPVANVATSSDELKLVLVDAAFQFGDERITGQPRFTHIDFAWWGEPSLKPTLPVGAYFSVGDLVLPAPRELVDPHT
jgi:hypothetical protein